MFTLCLIVGVLTVPLSRAQAEPDSPWGVSPSAALSFDPSQWVGTMADAGVRWVRGFRNGSGLEGVAATRRVGMSLCGILMWSPGSPATFPVSDLPGFRRYVIDRVTKYRGVVTHWEVWNEPPNFSEDKSAVSYGKVVAAAYDAAKSVDPSVKIGLAAKSTHVQFLADSIRAGARDKFDFVTLHPYEMAGLLTQGWEGPFLGIVPSVRAMLQETNPAKANAPVWFTEVGVATSDSETAPVSEAEQADSLIKLYVMGLAQGVARIHWFDPRDSEGLSLGLLRADNSPKPAYRALQALTRALGVRPEFLGYVPVAANTFGFLFAGPERDVLVAWTTPGRCLRLETADPVLLLHPQPGEETASCEGVSLNARPRLLGSPRGSDTALAWRSARRLQRPSWDMGSEANSVALLAGRRSLGVHVVGAVEPRCQAGKCEYDLSAGKEIRFAVDPLFQGYNAQALEVVMTLIPHGSDMAGFNLKYESRGPELDDHGMLKIGWNFVGGDRPQVLRWQISDPSFVGKYGANLLVDCDNVRHCDFGISGVIIRRR